MVEKPLILVVDDEPFYTDVLENLLQNEYRLIIARSGEEALEMVQTGPTPDLVLLDVLLPGIDGYEVCQRLQSDEKMRRTPIIFLTVKSNVDDEVRGFNLGAVDYISKPMSPPIVLARVRTHIKLVRTKRQLDNLLRNQ